MTPSRLSPISPPARPQGWWLPVLLLTGLSVGFTFAFTQRVGWERFMRQQIESNPRLQEMPAEQRERIIEQQARFAPIFGYLGSALAYLVLGAIAGGAFVFVFNVLLGAQLLFRQVFTLALYSFLPFGVGGVLALVMLFVKDPADFDLQHPLTSNLGAFLDPNTTPQWLIGLASSFDVFTLWVLLLLATGLAAAGRKISWTKAFTWVLATWGLWVGVKTGWAAIFSEGNCPRARFV